MAIVKTQPIEEVDFSYIPSILYKYRDWSNLHHRKLISEQQIFFSHPKDFDDLKDCKPPINFDFSYNKVLCEVSKSKRYADLDENQLTAVATRNYNERFSTSKKRRQRIAEFYESMNDRLGIFSAANTNSEW